MLVGIIFLQYDVSIPPLNELAKVSGKVTEFRCKGLSKYGDSLSIKLNSYDRWMFVQAISFSCREVKAQLQKSNYEVTVWTDTSGEDLIVRAFKINDIEYFSSQLGYSGKQLNIFSLMLACMGFALLFLPLNQRRV